MRAVIQRVSRAAVHVDGAQIAAIDHGALVLVCAMPGDDENTARALAHKIAKMRLFRDDQGKMNLSLLQTGGAALVVSQFTLAADTARGNRPGFSGAATPEFAQRLYLGFASAMAKAGVPTQTGKFGADMQVSLCNDGPVTICMDTEQSA